MLGKHSPNQSLADILTNIETARAYVGEASYDEFAANPEKVDAVLRRLQNAAEASVRLRNEWPEISSEVEERHPQIPWRRFRDLGNRYRHGYDNIGVDRVWEDLNGLLRHIEEAVSAELALSQVRDLPAAGEPS